MKNKRLTPLRETLAQAGLRHVRTLGNGEHLLEDKQTGQREVWFCNRNYAGYGLIYGNTHLEFVRSLTIDPGTAMRDMGGRHPSLGPSRILPR